MSANPMGGFSTGAVKHEEANKFGEKLYQIIVSARIDVLSFPERRVFDVMSYVRCTVF